MLECLLFTRDHDAPWWSGLHLSCLKLWWLWASGPPPVELHLHLSHLLELPFPSSASKFLPVVEELTWPLPAVSIIWNALLSLWKVSMWLGSHASQCYSLGMGDAASTKPRLVFTREKSKVLSLFLFTVTFWPLHPLFEQKVTPREYCMKSFFFFLHFEKLQSSRKKLPSTVKRVNSSNLK